MARSSIELIVDASKALNSFRQVTTATQKLDGAVKDVNGRLRDANGRFIAAGQSADNASKKINGLTAGLQRLAGQLAVADLARRFFQGFNEAEKAAAAVRTLGVDSNALEQQLLSVSNRLGGLYSQTQLLAASYDVASAGFANAADNAKILEASAKGAVGGLSDLNTVGNAVTSVLNSYGKSADQAAILVDGFIQTQNDGKIVLNEYAQQIGRLAPTAAAAGVGINELNAAVATITAQGVPVESTFSGLNQALVAILKPTDEAQKISKALGIEFNEAGLRAKGLGGLLEEVKTKTGGSTTQLVKLFGSVDALKVVLPLVNDDLVKFNKNLDNQTKAAGTADRATQELGGTVSSEITKMVNQIGNMARALDTVLAPILGRLVQLINFVIARATEGINVLGQLFSLSKNTAIAKAAIESGNIRGTNVGRVIPGIDELIGQQKRQQLQRQAGAGTGFLGMGFNAATFIELLKKEPAIKNLLGTNMPSKPSGSTATIDPELQALLNQLEGGSETTKKGRKAKPRESQLQALTQELALARDIYEIQGGILQARANQNKALEVTRQAQLEIRQIQDQIATVKNDKEMPAAEKLEKIAALEIQARTTARQLGFDLAEQDKEKAQNAANAIQSLVDEQALIQAKLDGNEAEVMLSQKIRDLKKQYPGLNEEDARTIIESTNKLKEQLQAAEQMKQLYADIGMSIKSGVVDAITSAIDGTKTLADVANDMLRNITNRILDVAINMALFGAMSGTGTGGGLLGGLFKGARAGGGPVSSGSAYLVGEQGPELFMPDKSGTIIPNNALGGSNIVVNVDAGGSSVQGDAAQAKALGAAIGAAVQSEILKQKKPGGLLY